MIVMCQFFFNIWTQFKKISFITVNLGKFYHKLRSDKINGCLELEYKN